MSSWSCVLHKFFFKNHVIIYTSCRLEGFKHARKKTTIAGQTTGVAAGQRLVRRGVRTVRVQAKGLGPGRMTCVKGLTVAGVHVVSITDHTPLKELGPRPRKIRRAKGLGPGRMTCVKGLTVAGVHVVSITDHTPLKELGPRPRKIRRV
ncbi:unnamed protein product [Nippostrongylus brasiliensis]|uniref:28S ribosomal protein S11, mitochondrial (inferred by orthology to a human protein) n=1 Tax=Nippostrongylus brasiliensis TaxID=27835 RepID=A0A0N4YZ32_NIPBR|nr:unnamed protein product [Nippostrongylus brasiliensis]